MRTHILAKSTLACAITLALSLPLAAQADTKVERFIHFGGVFGVAANDTTTVSYVQGLKRREESNTKFTGSVLGALQRFKNGSKGSDSVTISRVDQNKVYSLDPKEKTYSVHDMYRPEEQNKDEKGAEKDEDTKIVKNEFEVKDTGKTQKINGFDTHGYLITWNLETENVKSHGRSKSLMTTELWNASGDKLDKARKEDLAYTQAYMKLMHLPTNPDEFKEYGFETVTLSGADAKPFFDKLKTIKGYPISMDVKWEASSNGKDEEGKDQDAVKTLSGFLGSSDDAKKDENADGMTTVFTCHTEVKSVDTESLPADLFEVPESYKED
ncbi:MAG TPA: DUF4412 domain-containing protein [Gammaproteobacteria bacterium]